MYRFKREGREAVYIRYYAAVDGHLSFRAEVTEGPYKGQEDFPPPTLRECEQICPEGWQLYIDCGIIRAKLMFEP